MKKPGIPSSPRTPGREQFDTAVKETLEIIVGARGEKIVKLRGPQTVRSIMQKINEVLTHLQEGESVQIEELDTGLTVEGTLAVGGDANVTGNVSLGGNLVFTTVGDRITGDFSNATVANRVMFQTSTVNGATRVEVIPNGTGTTSNLSAYNNSDPTNAAATRLTATSADSRVESIITGTGTYIPMTFYTGGSERMRLPTDRSSLLVGTSSVPANAWVGGQALMLGDRSALYQFNSGGLATTLGNNVYHHAAVGDKFITATGANKLMLNGSSLQYQRSTNASPAADAAVTWTTDLNVDSGGRVTMPNQPMFYGTPTTDYSAGGFPAGSTVIPMNVLLDVAGNWNTSTHRFTCPVAGKYRVTWGGLTLPSHVSSVMRNGSRFQNGNHFAGTGISYINMTQTVIINCAANDYIQIEGWNGGGYYAGGWYSVTIQLIG